ncbi:Glucose-repressible alcohol dehydrogenase transcriptional effector [Sphaceloma murrayae]|uniref:Glucose-repressible alcohol dehydrogenase transcriptional effector n=1 Tax=Sphaceloma murrayae TaxID=2082308 RepID=A0A2K1QJY5_9PEZI|nr:Glucose-repressible alcohol dehydrogenase transcriptional effector [Sphaceloma murrayae]
MYERPTFSGSTLVSKPSTAFSTTSSASSGGSARLLFGEIDASSLSSSSTTLTNCTVVRSTNASFLRFWHSDECRDAFLSYLDQRSLTSLRLVSLDVSSRLAPLCFDTITNTFRANTFAKRSRMRALERIGRHVRAFKLVLPYGFEQVLPPLIDTETGEEKNFTYTPVRPGSSASSHGKTREPKYGDWETTDLLVRQYPPLFHAAANSASFVQCLAALPNMSQLTIEGRGDDFHIRGHHRNISDFALVSLRAALENSPIHSLTQICLQDLPASAMKYLNPAISSQSSVFDWCSHVGHMSASIKSIEEPSSDQSSEIAIVQDYLRNFRNLESLSFAWSGKPGPLPLGRSLLLVSRPSQSMQGARRPSHPALRRHASSSNATRGQERASMHFPQLVSLSLHNMTSSADEMREMLGAHGSLRNLDFADVKLQSGSWEEALRPLRQPRPSPPTTAETGDVPIMLARDDNARQPMPSLERQDSGVSLTPPKVETPHRAPVWRETEARPARKVCFVEELHACELGDGSNMRSSTQRSVKKKRDVFGDACGELKRIFRGGLLRWP